MHTGVTLWPDVESQPKVLVEPHLGFPDGAGEDGRVVYSGWTIGIRYGHVAVRIDRDPNQVWTVGWSWWLPGGRDRRPVYTDSGMRQVKDPEFRNLLDAVVMAICVRVPPGDWYDRLWAGGYGVERLAALSSLVPVEAVVRLLGRCYSYFDLALGKAIDPRVKPRKWWRFWA